MAKPKNKSTTAPAKRKSRTLPSEPSKRAKSGDGTAATSNSQAPAQKQARNTSDEPVLSDSDVPVIEIDQSDAENSDTGEGHAEEDSEAEIGENHDCYPEKDID
jgi:BRCT domain type II-containing protein